MGGNYLLDTSIAVGFLRGIEEIRARIEATTAVCICATVLGELLYGIARSAKPEKGLRDVQEFVRDCPVLVCDEKTAGAYSLIRAGLAAKGKPIPENDIWIAASAVQHGLTLAARDEHFEWIDGLHLDRW